MFTFFYPQSFLFKHSHTFTTHPHNTDTDHASTHTHIYTCQSRGALWILLLLPVACNAITRMCMTNKILFIFHFILWLLHTIIVVIIFLFKIYVAQSFCTVPVRSIQLSSIINMSATCLPLHYYFYSLTVYCTYNDFIINIKM